MIHHRRPRETEGARRLEISDSVYEILLLCARSGPAVSLVVNRLSPDTQSKSAPERQRNSAPRFLKVFTMYSL
jgi:hypothetical protein